jgi:eukaryotic-like serine/threonine-protein kinase
MPEFRLLDGLRARLDGIYRLERELGGGGMSRVFLAEEVSLGRRVVLKVLPPDLAHMLSAERFEREVRVAARLQHPHIVPLLAAGRAGDVLYYTMPLVEGESLRSRLDQQRELPVAEATRLFREVADALSYAHRQGLMHRDIKPDNILLSHGHAMVTDFGIAKAVSEAVGGTALTQTGLALGTPAYMSPEQAAADVHTDSRADLYALGVVAYEMLAGTAPFIGNSPQALIAAHMTQTPPPLSGARPSVPAELAAIVHRCLEKRAADRYQDAGELVAALDRVVLPAGHSGAMTLPRLPDAPTVALPARTGMSRRALLAGGAAVGLLGVGFGGGALATRRSAPQGATAYRRLTFRRGMIRTARFAPDFQTVLYGALWDGDVCRVYTVRPESPESSPLALPPAAPLAVSSSGELALAMGDHRRGIMSYGTLARVPLAGGAPRELEERVKYADWSPDGRSLAIVRGTETGDQLEFPAGTVVATPDHAGGGFSFPRISPRGDAVAAFELDSAAWLNGRVVIFDRSGARRLVSAPYFNVFGLAWKGDEVWFTAADQLPLFRNTIHAMNASGRVRIVARMPGNVSLHDIAPDGRLLIARTDDRGGIAVRVPGESADRDLSWLDAPVLADISTDGRRILFSETGVGGGPERSAYLRGTDGSLAVRLGDGMAMALAPDGKWAIVGPASHARHLDVIPTGPGQALRLERPGFNLINARWHPDGRNAVVLAEEGTRPPRLYVLSIEGSTTRPVTPADLPVSHGGWAVSPDGAMVAVSIAEGVELFPTAGGASRRVPGVSSGSSVVGWIEGGVLVSEDPVASGVVFKVDPATGRRDTWADIEPQDPAGIMNLRLGSLVVTPDGRGYGYTWHRAISDLYLAEGMG